MEFLLQVSITEFCFQFLWNFFFNFFCFFWNFQFSISVLINVTVNVGHNTKSKGKFEMICHQFLKISKTVSSGVDLTHKILRCNLLSPKPCAQLLWLSKSESTPVFISILLPMDRVRWSGQIRRNFRSQMHPMAGVVSEHHLWSSGLF